MNSEQTKKLDSTGTEHPIGTRVRINDMKSQLHGEEATVIGGSEWFDDDACPPGFMGQRIDITNEADCDGICAFPSASLIPIYDGHEPCAWDESLFHPFKDSARV